MNDQKKLSPNPQEVAARIKALRQDMDISAQQMADYTGRSLEEYTEQEEGRKDLSFTFLYKCAEALGVDVVDFLTGQSPHLTGYEITRKGAGISIPRGSAFEYLHKGSFFKKKLCEPFVVTIPFEPGNADALPHQHQHDGQELDFVLSGTLRFAYGDHVEELGPGDCVYYDSANPHGEMAAGGTECVFIAVVIKPKSHPSIAII
ncbi:MAG: XRE family transcriptional regulator [Coriobacteriales bacterium]|jgi:transcriptional regulator with XRE-family HTH domain|nr:XRE family transcriptional regulator [Coriobacteriales bacterium]